MKLNFERIYAVYPHIALCFLNIHFDYLLILSYYLLKIQLI